ncbi:hypothetical protein [Synoicihabitans lomoniglobus]|uniref:Uncharacterized protein n=1 Tax=Synoicihabitans lomoniglobus TaxID=2909285 RepID=A0AAE9ZVV9_9BACT|nr:hypothetical protein [Opitutaceae bacterium LMO-M01]WED63428.1 hypothetical protein PXH66_13900 [Opitutaceae bacterium LMO-M01]
MDLPRDQLEHAFANTSLFEAKTWQLSPDAWPLTAAQIDELHRIGEACLHFHEALENLYLRSAADKNLLRNKPLRAPWVAEYLDRGKPEALVKHARDKRQRGLFPTVLRPDLLLTDDGFVMTELDSVPGGIGLTAFLNRLYADQGDVVGESDAMIREFHRSLAALAPTIANPLIAIVLSDESATYRPEMKWIAEQLQRRGQRVFCLDPDDLFPLGSALCFDVDGNPEKIDVVYRFFELHDLENIPNAHYIFEAWDAGELAVAPPMRPFQEEKMGAALFHHHLLGDYWREALPGKSYKLLKKLFPRSWVVDPAPLPPGAVLDGPSAGGRPLADWHQLTQASQKERDLILKISGFHETAWGARSVVYGADCSREEWQDGVEIAIQDAPTNLHVLQEYRKPRRLAHRLYPSTQADADQPTEAGSRQGRLRLCPYYFVRDGKTLLGGALATFCPPDKKIIHGMQDAALLPCRVVG